MKIIDDLLKNINLNTEYDPSDGGTISYIIKNPIDDIISKHGVNKVLEHINIEDIQNFLRAKKLQKIIKKK